MANSGTVSEQKGFAPAVRGRSSTYRMGITYLARGAKPRDQTKASIAGKSETYRAPKQHSRNAALSTADC